MPKSLHIELYGEPLSPYNRSLIATYINFKEILC